jgi:hypothetical protein
MKQIRSAFGGTKKKETLTIAKNALILALKLAETAVNPVPGAEAVLGSLNQIVEAWGVSLHQTDSSDSSTTATVPSKRRTTWTHLRP